MRIDDLSGDRMSGMDTYIEMDSRRDSNAMMGIKAILIYSLVLCLVIDFVLLRVISIMTSCRAHRPRYSMNVSSCMSIFLMLLNVQRYPKSVKTNP